jgi:phage protein D/phage baseplate assembly protein gpV
MSLEFLEIASFAVKVAGTKIDDLVFNQIVNLVVDSNLHLPDMAMIKFHDDYDLSIMSGTTFDVGKELEISVTIDSSPEVIFKGEITALEPDFTESGAALFVVRGYDKSHRLHRGRKTKVWANQKDSDIVSSIVSAAGLTASVDATSEQHVHLWQNNQTDMEFILSLAQANGYQVFFDGTNLNFKKYTAGQGTPIDLEWKLQLISFHPRLSAVQPVNKVTVQAWDPAAKQAVKGEKTAASSTANQGGVTDDGGAKAKTAFSDAAVLVDDVPGLTAAAAGTMAQSLYDRLHGEFVQAEGVCIGDPKIKAGTLVNVKEVGARFSGKYMVTSATHTYSSDRGYETMFSVHGRQPDTLADLLAPATRPDGDGYRALVSGVVPAVVTNSKSEDGLPTVKVKFPWLDDTLESGWARVAAPGAGPTRGIYYMPEVNDEVLIAFEHGDLNQPYVLGGLWNKNDAPPKKTDQVTADGKTKERIIQSRTGHVIILSDEDGKESITIRDKTGNNEIVIDSANNKLNIKIADGGVNIESKGAVTVKSTNGDLAFEGGNVSVKAARGDVKIEGTNCNIAAQASCEIKANASCTVQGTAGLTLKGAPPAQIAMTGTVSINNGALDVM